MFCDVMSSEHEQSVSGPSMYSQQSSTYYIYRRSNFINLPTAFISKSFSYPKAHFLSLKVFQTMEMDTRAEKMAMFRRKKRPPLQRHATEPEIHVPMIDADEATPTSVTGKATQIPIRVKVSGMSSVSIQYFHYH